jgi:oligopeptide/dipeptide ABC transporter ATP-binding protein
MPVASVPPRSPDAAPDLAPLCSVRGLGVRFPTRHGRLLRALDDVSLDIQPGESLGIVGESGSGKSVMALGLLGLLGPPARLTGAVRLGGVDMLRSGPAALSAVRGRVAGLILQDPTASLNPVRSIRAQLTESARRAGFAGARAEAEVGESLRSVGLVPDEVLNRFPFQLSGGMNQRVAIAMALVQHPRLLIADEPTTALDVSTQLGILGLLARVRKQSRMALLLISHDLAVVYQVTDRIAVLYAGRLVEVGPTEAIVTAPAHPYTRALVAAIPRLDGVRGRLETIPGQLRPQFDGDTGCPFRDRCRLAETRCTEHFPDLADVAPGHRAACWVLPTVSR